MGGAPGSRFLGQVRGTGLEGAYAVWFDAPEIRAKIKSTEDTPMEPDGHPGAPGALRGQTLQVEVEIGSAVPAGV